MLIFRFDVCQVGRNRVVMIQAGVILVDVIPVDVIQIVAPIFFNFKIIFRLIIFENSVASRVFTY